LRPKSKPSVFVNHDRYASRVLIILKRFLRVGPGAAPSSAGGAVPCQLWGFRPFIGTILAAWLEVLLGSILILINQGKVNGRKPNIDTIPFVGNLSLLVPPRNVPLLGWHLLTLFPIIIRINIQRFRPFETGDDVSHWLGIHQRFQSQAFSKISRLRLFSSSTCDWGVVSAKGGC
jgi:hypothetical protein